MIDPERWFVLTARIPSDDLRMLAAEGMLALGGAAVQEEGDLLVTYLLPPSDPEALLAETRAQLQEWLPPDTGLELAWSWQQNEDWSREWKRGLRPRKLTERLVVKPSWTEWEARPGEIVIAIDPQMAFGTGEHASTRGCLRLLDRAIRPDDRVLDVGSGSAVLSIAAARLGAREVVAVEYDPDANLNARENLEHNRVEGRVRLVEAMADAQLLRELGAFDLVVANILSSVIRPLLPAFAGSLSGSSAGRLIVSGILEDEHPELVRSAEAAGFRLAEVDEEEEWWSALLLPDR